jgi:hypothetical protein
MTTLLAKVESYGTTLKESRPPRMTNICFVVPTQRRAERLRDEGEDAAKHVPDARFWVTSAPLLEAHGPLAEIWRRLDHEDLPYGMGEFEPLNGADTTPREQSLGRRWQVPMPERWAALSPLGTRRGVSATAATDTRSAAVEDDELAHEWERRRAQERAEAEREARPAPATGPPLDSDP